MLDIYVSFIYEIFLFLMLMFLSNFNQYSNSDGVVKEYVSLSFSIAIALFCTLIFIFTIYFWFRSRDTNYLENIKYFKGFFSGLKNTNKARTHWFMYFLRRILLWVIVVLLNSHLNYKIALLLFVQLCYTVYNMIVRPFDSAKDNILETLNDLNYSTLIMLLFWYQKADDWTSLSKSAYLYIMMSNNIIFSIVGICKHNFLTP